MYRSTHPVLIGVILMILVAMFEETISSKVLPATVRTVECASINKPKMRNGVIVHTQDFDLCLPSLIIVWLGLPIRTIKRTLCSFAPDDLYTFSQSVQLHRSALIWRRHANISKLPHHQTPATS